MVLYPVSIETRQRIEAMKQLHFFVLALWPGIAWKSVKWWCASCRRFSVQNIGYSLGVLVLALEMPVGSSALTAEAEVGAFHCLQQFVEFTEVKSRVSNCLTGFFFFLFCKGFFFLMRTWLWQLKQKLLEVGHIFHSVFFSDLLMWMLAESMLFKHKCYMVSSLLWTICALLLSP